MSTPILTPMKLGAGMRIPISALRDTQLADLYHDLTLIPDVPDKYGFGSGAKTKIVLFSEDQEYVKVPRYYAVEKLGGLMQQCTVDDETELGQPVDFKWVGDDEHRRRAAAAGKPDWADRQIAWVDALHDAIMASPAKGAVGEAPTSFGKTVCMMRLIARLGRTTLVIVHKDFLLQQWTKAAKEWLGLTDDEIGIVQGPRCDVPGKKLVFAMVETLTSREFSDAFYRWPGVVIGDEVHRLGAEQWGKAMPMFPAKYRVGVSATPRRRDGLDRVFRWTIGPVAVREKEWYNKATVYQVAWPVTIPVRSYAMARYDPSEGKMKLIKIFLAKLVNAVVRVPGYTDWLVQEIVRAAEKGRCILVLSDRRAHLEALKEAFDICVKGKYKSAFCVGGQSKKEQAASVGADVRFGTFGKAKEGLDIQELDTLFLTTPRADVEQDIGRILRVYEDKKTPLVVDIVHLGVEPAERFAEKRARLYRSKDFEVVRVGPW